MRDTLLAFGAFGFFIMLLVLFAFVLFGPFRLKDEKNKSENRKSNKIFWGILSFLSICMVIVFVLSFTI